MIRTLVSRVAAISFAILSSAFLSSADTDIPGHVYFSYAEGNPDIGIMSRKPEYAGGAMLLTEELTYRYDGCRIEEISIANGYFPNQDIAPIQIFCTSRLDSAPFLALDSEMDLDHPHEYKAHALPQPLTIQGGKPFYVGFVVWSEGRELPDFSCPLVTDRSDTDSPGRYTAWSETTDRPEKMDWTDDIASGQLCIKLKISGGKMPVNVAELNKVSMTDYIETSAACNADLYVTNRGMNAISDIDVSCRVGNHTESYHVIFHSPLEYNGTGVERIKVSSKEQGANIPVTFTIDKVNGSDASDTACRQQEFSIHSLARGNGFFRNMVVEEAGGSGCGWCVRGIVGLDRTFKAHDDGTFIPISSHGSGYGEETCAEGYEVFHDRYIEFVPTCLINRKVARHGIVDPSSERLEGYYRMETADPAIAALEVTGYEFCGNELTVESEVEFACGETGADYRVAYVVTEDGVGPYMQANSYSGEDVDMDGWENLPFMTPAYYDFLARGISDFYGTGDGLPADIEPGVRYRHCGKVPLDKVRDFDRLHVVGMVINAGTGCIENGTRMKISRGMGAGGITDGVGDGPVEYFDLAGRRIGGVPSPGVYVRRQGSHSAKIVIRQP